MSTQSSAKPWHVLAITILVSGVLFTAQKTEASDIAYPESHHVDLVLALDVSDSMSGLINSAKQRLWDIVNEVGQAGSAKTLRVALITYGNPSYGEQTGYVRVDQPLTSDLDAVNDALFRLTTSGGTEYVARAVTTAINELAWDDALGSKRIVFVAGNERATQDPKVSLDRMASLARQSNVRVNAIYCGTANSGDAASWASVAQLSGGAYANIDQNAAAVAVIETPMDAELAKLNEKLNETYVPYGAEAEKKARNQVEQDRNAERMSHGALASRAVAKASRLYSNESWDLVDAVAAGKDVAEMAEAEIPEALKGLDADEALAVIKEKAEERQSLKAAIEALGQRRDDFVRENAPASAAAPGLDDALKQEIRRSLK